MSLEETLGELLISQRKTIAVAESLTGGLISDLLTNVPGSSRYFLGSIVSYSNESKMHLLDVQWQTLLEHGAVSSQTALEMAEGARRSIASDIGAAVTGIAGPGGGTEAKPVGLVYFCVSDGKRRKEDRAIFEGERLEIKRKAAQRLLQDAIDFLDDLNP